jgi:hypothetical protein
MSLIQKNYEKTINSVFAAGLKRIFFCLPMEQKPFHSNWHFCNGARTSAFPNWGMQMTKWTTDLIAADAKGQRY